MSTLTASAYGRATARSISDLGEEALVKPGSAHLTAARRYITVKQRIRFAGNWREHRLLTLMQDL
jgi:hypothetical protein